MGKETVRYGMNRRGFLGAAAGAAAGAAVASTFPQKARGDSDPSAHDQVGVPPHTVGIQTYTYRNLLPPSATEQARQTYFPAIYNAGVRRIEVYGGNNFGLGGAAQARAYLESNTKPWHNNPDPAADPYEWGFDIYGDHNGPSTGSGKGETQVNQRIDQLNNYGLKHLGVGGGWGQGSNTPENWLTATENANLWGQLYQQGTPSREGVPGARWYGHNHGAELGVFGAGSGEWTGRRYIEVFLENADVRYSCAEIDLAWARQGFGSLDNPAVTDEWLEFVLEYSNRPELVPMYHVKGVNTSGQEVDVNQPGDVLTAGGYWQKLFEGLKDLTAHTFFIERDGNAPNFFNESNHLESMERFRSLLQETPIDRSKIGAPGNVTPPEVQGVAKVGKALRCMGDDRGEWVRFPKKRFSFQWTRNGLEIPGATKRKYVTTSADAGKRIAVVVTARNANGSTQETAEPITMNPTAGPQVIEPPTVSGTGMPGTMVTVSIGKWSAGGSVSIQWYHGNTPIPHGTAEGTTASWSRRRCRVNADWLGEEIRCEITRSNAKGSTTAMSANSVTVLSGNITPPTVSGSGRPGSMVRVDQGDWSVPGPNTFQWYRDDTPIPQGMGPGETGSTNPKRCRIDPAWSGQEIRCEITRKYKRKAGTEKVMSANSVTVQ